MCLLPGFLSGVFLVQFFSLAAGLLLDFLRLSFLTLLFGLLGFAALLFPDLLGCPFLLQFFGLARLPPRLLLRDFVQLLLLLDDLGLRLLLGFLEHPFPLPLFLCRCLPPDFLPGLGGCPLSFPAGRLALLARRLTGLPCCRLALLPGGLFRLAACLVLLLFGCLVRFFLVRPGCFFRHAAGFFASQGRDLFASLRGSRLGGLRRRLRARLCRGRCGRGWQGTLRLHPVPQMGFPNLPEIFQTEAGQGQNVLAALLPVVPLAVLEDEEEVALELPQGGVALLDLLGSGGQVHGPRDDLPIVLKQGGVHGLLEEQHGGDLLARGEFVHQLPQFFDDTFQFRLGGSDTGVEVLEDAVGSELFVQFAVDNVFVEGPF
mmetsp:Transcript_14819/g.32842  ORF Transcript_14819/g.32842 Transcript_14819/m.32842 type:complete len:374 (-) Transcript_14819:2641-3762(-)